MEIQPHTQTRDSSTAKTVRSQRQNSTTISGSLFREADLSVGLSAFAGIEGGARDQKVTFGQTANSLTTVLHAPLDLGLFGALHAAASSIATSVAAQPLASLFEHPFRELAIAILLLALSLAATADAAAAAALEPNVPVEAVADAPAEHDFGVAGLDDEVTHRFEFTNPGAERLEISSIRLTPPLLATKARAMIPPGGRGSVSVRLGAPREKGPFQGIVIVQFRNAGVPDRVFRVSGTIRPAVDVEPHAAFFVAVSRGESKRSSVDIVNHDTEPLRIIGVEHAGARSSTQLETLEPGRRYRLWLDVQGSGAAGKLTETIRVFTDHRRHAVLQVQANTLLRERVYSFPDRLDLGVIQIRRIERNPAIAEFLGQTLMVYCKGAEDFRLTADTDIPFLDLHTERSRFQDRYQIEVKLIPDRLRPGTTTGSIVLSTNDPQFPRLVVPVTATLE